MHFAQTKGFFTRLTSWIDFFFQNWTVRARLTFLYVAIFGSTLVAFSSLLYRSFVIDQQNEFDIALYNHAVDIAQGIHLSPFGNLEINPGILSTGGKIFPFSAGQVYIQIHTLNGTEIARSGNLGKAHLPLSPDDLKFLPQNRGIFRTLTGKDLHLHEGKGEPGLYRLLTAMAPGQSSRDFILEVAVPQIFLTQVINDLKRFLWIGIPLTLIVAMFGGFYLSGRAFVPVSRMIEKANQLSPYHLWDRIPVPHAEDELKDLALTLNDLLDRLQRAFESQERFIADASHELKTPLTILRGELDVFKSRARSAEEVSAFITSAMEELNYLSRVVEDLLILARVDAGSDLLAKNEVRFDEIVLEVISKLDVLGRQKQIKIRFNLSDDEQELSLHADPDLLKILVKNLVENAIKYSPPSQVVDVSMRGEPKWIYLDVTNRGTIPEEIIPKLFQRFYRGPQSSTHSISGAGLGLAIVRRIAEAHNGQVSVVSSQQLQQTTFSACIKRF